MEHIEKNIYRDKSTKIVYKINQKFSDYSYFDCFDGSCHGRLRLDKKNVKHIMNAHTVDHPFDLMENELTIREIGKTIIEMARNNKFDKHGSSEIYEQVLKLYPNVTLPVGHYASALKSVRNARFRSKSKFFEIFFA